MRLLIVAICIGTFAAGAAYAQSLSLDVPEGVVFPDGGGTAGSSVTADLDQPAAPATTPEHTGFKALVVDLYDDVKHLPSKENLFWAATGGAGALAVHPADTRVTAYFVNAPWAHNAFVLGAYLGDTPELLAISATVYAVGRLDGDKRVSHLGMDLIQAIAVSNAIVQSLKFTVQRERPDHSDTYSFPSGHASDTFACATALERHLGWKGAVPAYAFASWVAMSRMHDNRHYLSDVVFGSTTGIIAGRTVTRHGRPFPVAMVPIPGGAALVYERRAP